MYSIIRMREQTLTCICISDNKTLPSLVIFSWPAPSTNILRVPLGPKFDFTTWASPVAPVQFKLKACWRLTCSALGFNNSMADLWILIVSICWMRVRKRSLHGDKSKVGVKWERERDESCLNLSLSPPTWPLTHPTHSTWHRLLLSHVGGVLLLHRLIPLPPTLNLSTLNPLPLHHVPPLPVHNHNHNIK